MAHRAAVRRMLRKVERYANGEEPTEDWCGFERVTCSLPVRPNRYTIVLPPE